MGGSFNVNVDMMSFSKEVRVVLNKSNFFDKYRHRRLIFLEVYVCWNFLSFSTLLQIVQKVENILQSLNKMGYISSITKQKSEYFL